MNIDNYLEIINFINTDLINPSKKELIDIMNSDKDVDGIFYNIKKEIEIENDITTYDFDMHFADIIFDIEINSPISIQIDDKIIGIENTIPLVSLDNSEIQFKTTSEIEDKILINISAIKLNTIPIHEFKYYNKRMVTNNHGLKIINGKLV